MEQEINDTSLIGYTATGATTNHIFSNILNAGLDTLFVVAAVNGDFDQTTESAEVFIDGVLLGPIATGSLTLGDWDSITFAITDPLLSTVLADGMIDVSIVNNNQVKSKCWSWYR